MYTAITILIVITCVLLVLVVLVQNPKGGGISSGIIGTNQVMGVKKTTDFIERLTWGLTLTLVVLCLIAGMSLPDKEERGLGTSLQEQVDNAGTSPAPMPSQQSPSQNQPAGQSGQPGVIGQDQQSGQMQPVDPSTVKQEEPIIDTVK